MLIEKIRIDGGRLCLNYINTIDDWFQQPLQDYLASIEDLIDWAVRVKIITSPQSIILKTQAQKTPNKTQSFFIQAKELRQLLYLIFRKLSKKETIPKECLLTFNRLLGKCLSKIKIKAENGNFTEDWIIAPIDFEMIIYPIIKDAYHSLLSDNKIRIKECPKCGWLFYDSSKNGKRKWCSMEVCGSRIKAKNWYHRKKE